jgi:hypothetical protein
VAGRQRGGLGAGVTVHVLRHGLALCGAGVPASWPAGDRWVSEGDNVHADASCLDCIAAVGVRGACGPARGCSGTGVIPDYTDSGSGRECYCDCLAGLALRRADRARQEHALGDGGRCLRCGSFPVVGDGGYCRVGTGGAA